MTQWGRLVPGPELTSVGLVSVLETVLHFLETSSSEIRGHCLLIPSIHLWSRTRILKPLSERLSTRALVLWLALPLRGAIQY